jgi:hypothetical protein
MYFKGGSAAPSCGLLPPASREIVPLLEPDDHESFPQCSGFAGALRFRWGDQFVYVVRVLQRDTTEDTSNSDIALAAGPSGLEKPEGIDQGAMPDRKPLLTVAAWVKSQLVGSADAKAGFQPSQPHLALAGGAFLSVGIDAAGGRCRLSAGAVTLDAPPVPAVVPCSAVRATTGFASGTTTWFVALVTTPDARSAAHVFRVDATKAGPAPEYSSRLATVAAGGKILVVRDTLRKLVAER